MKEAVIRGLIVGGGFLIQILLSIFIYLFLIDKIFIIHLFFLFIQAILMPPNKSYEGKKILFIKNL